MRFSDYVDEPDVVKMLLDKRYVVQVCRGLFYPGGITVRFREPIKSSPKNGNLDWLWPEAARRETDAQALKVFLECSKAMYRVGPLKASKEMRLRE